METKENVNANCMYRQMITIDSVSVSDLQEISGKDNVTIVIERGGHLVINENFAVGRNCLIDAREGCLTVNNNCTFALGENTVLMLANCPVDGSGTLEGHFARVDAPIAYVFDPNLKLIGDWSVDRAYPQWFAPFGTNDWSTPINMAIDFVRCGEVFLPRGLYPVKGTIYVKLGVHLVGSSSCRMTGNPEGNDPTENFGSIIQAVAPSGDNDGFASGFMLMVNARQKNETGPSWNTAYPNQGTLIKDLILSNNPNVFAIYGTEPITQPGKNVSGIFFSGAVEISDVSFLQLHQGIVSDAYVYADLKKVKNCIFYGTQEEKESSDFAYDLSGLGDGLVFDRNFVDTRDNGLKLDQCMGGRVCSNILTKAYFRNCRGIVFESNHMEINSQVEIVKSIIGVKNNYIEMGNCPSIYIHSADPSDNNEYDRSVVTLSGNCHCFIDGSRFPSGQEDEASLSERLENICEYDVCIDRNSMVRIENEYRYKVHVKLPNSSHPYGIKICQKASIGAKNGEGINYEPIDTFNLHSHLYSEKCSIRSNFVMAELVDDLDPIGSIGYLAPNEWTDWAYENDASEYVYFYQLYKNGALAGVKTPCMSGGATFTPQSGKNGEGECRNFGAMFCVWNMEGVGQHALVRLTRENITANKKWHVDVPLAGTRFLWDNGVSVSGFKWVEE